MIILNPEHKQVTFQVKRKKKRDYDKPQIDTKNYNCDTDTGSANEMRLKTMQKIA